MSLEAFQSAWSDGMIRACWQTTLLVTVVWLACRLLLKRAAPATRATLWWIAILKSLAALFIGPAIFLPVLSPPAPTPLPTIAKSAAGSPSSFHDQPALLASVPGRTEFNPLLVLWLAGGIGVACLKAAQWRRVHAIVRASVPLEYSHLSERVYRLAGLMGLDIPPRIVSSPLVTTPFVFGAGQAILVVPDSFKTELTDDELEMALSHEMAHLVRRDPLTGWVPAAAQVLFYFLPPIWIALREWSIEREAACDERAIAVTRARPTDYGQMLMKLVVEGGRCVPMPALSATAAYHTLRKRMEMIKSNVCPSARLRAAAPAIVGCGLLFALPWQLAARPAPANQQASYTHPGPTTILCKVVDEAGNPVPGASVGAIHNQDPHRFDGGMGTGPTDKNGEISLTVPWTYDSFLFVHASYKDMFSDFKVRPQFGRTLIVVHKVHLATVRGLVLDSNGKPVEGVKVGPIWPGDTTAWYGDLNSYPTKPTGADGRYTIQGMYPGDQIMVGANKEGFKEADTPWQIARDNREMPVIRLGKK